MSVRNAQQFTALLAACFSLAGVSRLATGLIISAYGIHAAPQSDADDVASLFVGTTLLAAIAILALVAGYFLGARNPATRRAWLLGITLTLLYRLSQLWPSGSGRPTSLSDQTIALRLVAVLVATVVSLLPMTVDRGTRIGLHNVADSTSPAKHL